MNENNSKKNNTSGFFILSFSIIIFLCLPFLLSPDESVFPVNKDVSFVRVKINVSSLHKFTGKLKLYETDFRYDETRDIVTNADFSFNFSDLKMGSKKKEKKMLKWMEHQVYPEARFEMVSELKIDGKRIMTGNFKMHGITKELEIPFTFSIKEDKFVIEGNCLLDYRDFSLSVLRFLFLKVKPILTIQFHFEGSIIRK